MKTKGKKIKTNGTGGRKRIKRLQKKCSSLKKDYDKLEEIVVAAARLAHAVDLQFFKRPSVRKTLEKLYKTSRESGLIQMD